MIAACPNCPARYRIEDARIGPQGARLRCVRCQGLFRIPSPATLLIGDTDSPASDPPLAIEHRAHWHASSGGERLSKQAEKVLLADSQAQRSRSTAAALAGMGLSVRRVHDAVEALLHLRAECPRLVVLAADLPRMNGWDLCEYIKRDAALQAVCVVVVGSSRRSNRTSEAGRSAYGPDLRVDPSELPGQLGSLLTRLESSHPVPAPNPETDSSRRQNEVVSSRFVAEEEPPAADGSGDHSQVAEREKAERLARIVVSDMLLYHPERFDLAVDEEKLIQEFQVEIHEGRTLLAQRVSERCLAERDYLVEELVRVSGRRALG